MSGTATQHARNTASRACGFSRRASQPQRQFFRPARAGTTHGKAATGRIGRKYHHGPPRWKLGVMTRCQVSRTKTYCGNMGIRVATATNQGRATAAKASIPRQSKRRRSEPFPPVSSVHGRIVASGTSRATGPLVRAPTPIATQASTGRSSKKQRIAAVVHKDRVESKIAARA